MEPIPPFSAAARSLRPGRYEHYRAGMHRVLEVVRHSESLEELVHYVHEADGSHWVRPLAMFLEDVEIDGARRPRFRFIEADA